MYSPHSSGIDSATINPAALNSPGQSHTYPRGLKRGRSPDTILVAQPGDDGAPDSQKRRRPMKPAASARGVPDAPGQSPAMRSGIPPPQTPQNQAAPLPQSTPTYGTPAPPRTTPTKSTLKALPTVRDHTTDQLNSTGDEYIPREVDDFGEKKVTPMGNLTGNRVYRCRTFLVPNRGEKLFMLATECARVLGYRDSYLLFNKNRSLYKIIASQAEKDDLVTQEILPFSYRSRQIAIVTARSMFRQFGSRVIEGGRRVRDDYWETKARKQGFTEADPAGEKRPGASKAREAAEQAQNNAMMGQHSEIVYNNASGPYPTHMPPHLVNPGPMGGPLASAAAKPGAMPVAPELTDSRPRDYGSTFRGGPRQEITGPPYQDQTRPSPLSEIQSQAHHAADFNKSLNQQREMRGDYLQNLWRRPHEQPSTSPSLNPPSGDSSLPPTSRSTTSPHATASGMPQPAVPSQSPQMMMTSPPYSQSIPAGQPPMRGSSIGQTPSYNYQPGQPMWSQSPQGPQHNYGSYSAQGSSHPSQSPAPHLRQPSGSMQPGMGFPGGMNMQYGYGDQTPRQYMPQNQPGPPAVSQAWSSQHSQPQQWWAPSQQPQ